jgi:lipoprotein LpqS
VLTDVRRQPLLRSVIAIAAAVWLLVAGCGGALEWSVRSAPDGAHTVLTSPGGAFAVNADHAHSAQGSPLACQELFATAVLPGWAPPLPTLGLGAGAGASSFADLMPKAGRGPRGEPAAVLTGQELLTRFCVARR